MTTKRYNSWFKAGYGSLETGVSAMELLIQVYLMEFYVVILKLNPLLAGLALAIAVVWDAITDPVLGWLSDNTRSRYGRRLPFIAAGIPLFAGAFYLMFNPPPLNSQATLFSFLLLIYILTNTFMTLVAVPHTALAGELSEDGNERTAFFGWRLVFANLGLLAGLILPALLLKSLATGTPGQEETALSRGLSATIIACLALIMSLPTLIVLRRKKEDNQGLSSRHVETKIKHPSWKNPVRRSLRQIHKNRVFIILALTFMVLAIGRTLNASLALFYYKIHLNLSEKDVILYTLGLFFIVIMLSVVFWLYISRKFGKKAPALGGMIALGIMTCILYPLIPPGLLWPTLVASVFGGVAAGAVILLESLVADSIDWDELRTGRQSQGLYFGYWRMASKMARALGLLLAGLLLQLIGFSPESTVQPEFVGFRLSLLFGPGVGLFFLLAALLLAFMPLNKDTHNRIQSLLQKRRLNRAVLPVL